MDAVAVVAALLAEQAPHLVGLPLAEVARGQDNVVVRVGDRLAARLPRADHALCNPPWWPAGTESPEARRRGATHAAGGLDSWAGLMALSLAVDLMLLWAANVYLRHYRIAPVEWAWRSIVEGRRLPFRRERPAVEVSLAVLNRDAVIRRLADNLDDLYIMSRPPQAPPVVATPFLSNPLVVVASTAHPLAGCRRKLEIEAIAAEHGVERGDARAGGRQRRGRVVGVGDVGHGPRLGRCPAAPVIAGAEPLPGRR